MNNGRKQHAWVHWVTEHGVRILILLAIAFMAFVYTRSRSDTEARLGAIEDRVKQQVPRAYTAPNLDDYTASGVTTDSLSIHKAEYVPVYSHIYHDGGRPYLLEVTLSVRNVDPVQPVYIGAVEYYDTDGELAKEHLDRLIRLEPLQTIEFLVERKDAVGGSGANFIVEWHADKRDTHAPLIEAVMVGRSGTNAISFVRRSEPLPQWEVD